MSKLTEAFKGMMQHYNRSRMRYALIGDNVGTILNTARVGFVFVRVAGASEVLTVYNSVIPHASLIVGLPVWIRTDDEIGSQWYIASGVRDDNGNATTTGANINGTSITITNNSAGSATPGAINAVIIKAANYTLTVNDSVVVFTATATATLPAATATGRTYRIICRAGALTIDGNASETIKGELTQKIYAGEDLIITDTASGIWE